MPRKLLILAATLVGAHLAQVLFLGVSPAGTLIANLLQVSASALAALTCLGVSRRARGMARPFWALVACGMAAWGFANLGWMYYELVLHTIPTPGSSVRFFFSLQGIFFAMVLFLDQDNDSGRFKPEFLLDFIQIVIVFFFVFLGLNFLPSPQFQQQSSYVRQLWMQFGEESVILALACYSSIPCSDCWRSQFVCRFCAIFFHLYGQFRSVRVSAFPQGCINRNAC